MAARRTCFNAGWFCNLRNVFVVGKVKLSKDKKDKDKIKVKKKKRKSDDLVSLSYVLEIVSNLCWNMIYNKERHHHLVSPCQ